MFSSYKAYEKADHSSLCTLSRQYIVGNKLRLTQQNSLPSVEILPARLTKTLTK